MTASPDLDLVKPKCPTDHRQNEGTTLETFEFTKHKIASERLARARRLCVIALAAFVSGSLGFAWADSGSTLGVVRIVFLGIGGVLVAYLLTAPTKVARFASDAEMRQSNEAWVRLKNDHPILYKALTGPLLRARKAADSD